MSEGSWGGLPDGGVRAILAVVIVIGGLVLFGIDKLEFTELMALTSLPTGLYFGQYISKPGE